MGDEKILHQEDTEEVMDDVIESGVGKDHAAIATPVSPGTSYLQSEAVATRNAVASILTVLRDNGLIAP